MKKKFLFALACVLLGGWAFLCFNACDKDTNCYVQVNVVDDMGGTPLPVANAWVKIDSDSSQVKAEGYTDAAGVYRTMFVAPAIFNVAVKMTVVDEDYPADSYQVYRKGSNTLRLKEGDTVYSTVILEKDTVHLPL